MAENSLLGKLDGLVSRFEEVGTLITDPAVIRSKEYLWAGFVNSFPSSKGS